MEKFIEQLPVEVTDIRAASGGDVNDAYKIYSNDNLYYMLVQRNCDGNFYDGEIAGLKLFDKIGIKAPKVIDHGFCDGDAYLLLSFLDEGSIGSQSELAETVANMHKYKSPNDKFGFNYEYRGSSTSFTNEWVETWSELFLDQRMDVLAKQLIELDLWTSYDFEKYKKVYEIMKEELLNHKSEPSFMEIYGQVIICF